MKLTSLVGAVLCLWLCTTVIGTLGKDSSSSPPPPPKSLVNKQVSRTIDLTSQLAIHSIDLTLENSGPKAVSDFFFALTDDFGSNLSYLNITKVTTGSNGPVLQELKYTKDTTIQIDQLHYVYSVALPSSLQPATSVELKIEMIFIHKLVPFPAEITQSENQMVKYEDNHYYFSLYPTESVKTKLKLSSATIQSSSELHPSSIKGETVTYGPYKDIGALTISPLLLHFENNRPFITIDHVQRWIEVSHWGNVAVEETYKLQHDGAKLKGTFSRYDFQINAQANGQAAVQVLSQLLPEQASDVYYRDDIGNISTSALRTESSISKQVLELRPRFPLFGGWKTEFLVGYNLPTYTVLGVDYESGKFVLRVPFLAEWNLPIAVNDQSIKVVLPEGAYDIAVDLPIEVSKSTETLYTYLDFSGRPVVVISKKNLNNVHHNIDLVISYHFSSTSLLFEPFLLIGAYLSFFLLVIVVVRLDFSIYGDKSHRISDPQVVTCLEAVNQIYEERAALHEKVENDFVNFKRSSSDEKSYEKDKKATVLKFLEFRKKIADLKFRMASSPFVVNALTELEKKQEEKEELQSKYQHATLKLLRSSSSTTTNESQLESEVDRQKELYEAKKEEIEEDLEKLLTI